MSDEKREMTLKEWCDKLPKDHRVNKDLNEITKCIGLLNSMVNSGEQHSEESINTVTEVFKKL